MQMGIAESLSNGMLQLKADFANASFDAREAFG
jgi:hypothetical protein